VAAHPAAPRRRKLDCLHVERGGPIRGRRRADLATLSKLQFGSVPTGKGGYDWYVEKVSTGYSKARGVMQGVMWILPWDMFEDLGSRITGSLAVSFVPNRRQDIDEEWVPKPGARASACCRIPEGR
jgi:hypothetical protein